MKQQLEDSVKKLADVQSKVMPHFRQRQFFIVLSVMLSPISCHVIDVIVFIISQNIKKAIYTIHL